MSSFNEQKNPPVSKYKSKIPTSSPKSETKQSLPAIPHDQLNRLTNAKSRSVSNTSLATAKSRMTTPASSLKRMFEKKYTLLKKHSYDIKEGFLTKQKELEKVYKEVIDLREKMVSAGTEDVEDIGDVLFTLIPTKSIKKRTNMANMLDIESAEKFIASLKPKLEEMPNTLLEMCRATLVKRSELTQQLSQILTHPKDKELLSKLDTLKGNDEESLALETMQANYKVLISSVVAELNKFLTDIKSYHATISANLSEDLTEKLTATITELNTERTRNSGLAEKKSALEKQMAEMKVKIKKLEEQLSERETRLSHQRQKESNLDQGIKDLKNSMEKTKEALEIRIKELKKENDLKEKELDDYKKETEGRVKEFVKELEEEIMKRKAAETHLAELQQRYAKLEEKSMNLYEMTVDLKSIKGKDADLTENELVLYEKLKYAQEKIDTLQNQVSELESAKDQLNKIFENNEGEADHVDLEAQLMLQIANNNLLNNKYEKLRQNFDKISEENRLLEKQLLEMKSHMLMKADEVENDKLALEIAQLNQQLNDIKSALAESRDRNTQLEKSLTKAQLSLDSKDRDLKRLQQILQQRFEVFQVLKPEVFASNEMNLQKGNNDDQNKLINEYIESLSEKQKKIETMKKTINRLMDQEHRAQKSRTNLEHRIAELEKENSELKNQKPRTRILGIF